MRSFGCLGFALPAAIGACLADRKRKVISLSGDGAFLFNCQELSTAATYGLKNFIQIILNNNGFASLHNIASRKFVRQNEYYLWDRIDYRSSPKKITPALKKTLSGNGPYLINVITAGQVDMKGAFWTKK